MRAYMLKFLLLALTFTTFVSAQQKPAAAAAPGAIALRGGKVMTITKGTIENGVVVMQDGKIVAVGPAASTTIPRGARVIDVTGMTVYPGLIDSQTQLGLTEIGAVDMTNDVVEPSDNITPHMHVYDAFHAESELIPVTRVNGVTNVIVTPTMRNTLPGQASFYQLDGSSSEQMLLVRDIAMPMNFTGAQKRSQSFEGGGRATFPATRMGLAAQLRQAFLDAQDYAQKQRAPEKKEGDKGDAKPPKRDLKLEALLPYLQGETPVVLAAEEPSDIKVAVSLAREFKLKFILNLATHGTGILDDIAALKAPVIVAPVYRFPEDNERYDVNFRLPAELNKRGVKLVFASYDAHDVRNLPYIAGYAVAFGLPYDEAMKAMTINPAEVWGVADKFGSLEAGKVANVVVANGDPLDVRTDVKHVFINGREIPMETRHTRLRDQYWK